MLTVVGVRDWVGLPTEGLDVACGQHWPEARCVLTVVGVGDWDRCRCARRHAAAQKTTRRSGRSATAARALRLRLASTPQHLLGGW
jgi:hypothetical protein